jgi:hypothetical protein
MTKEEKATTIKSGIEKAGLFKVLSVDSINHKPHMYMIGPSHIAKNSGMYLDIDEVERKGVRCAHPNCNLTYKEHTWDTVAFLQLQRNGTNAEAQRILGAEEVATQMKQAGVEGFVFVDSEEKFRIS